jgi:elongator complex protein 3
MDKHGQAMDFIIAGLRKGGDLAALKLDAARKFGVARVPRNSDLIARLRARNPRLLRSLLPLLQKRPMRTLSGVTPVAVMVKPEGSCPYSCIYCPAGLGAKSYTGFEPAALRARQEGFDACGQVRNRLRHYSECGHPTDKCELILMGGTFLRMPGDYRRSFVKGIYDGLNGKTGRTLSDSQKINERAGSRAVGLTIETRPDVCGESEISEMLFFGATRCELGVQHPDDEIYRAINRGHGTADVVRATALLKDSAFKVLYHIMPGLPGSNPARDVAMVKRLFSDEGFRPDMLKIYPALVMPGTGLEKMMREGDYEPYGTETAVETISEFYRHVPSYVRVMRIQRDIPVQLIAAGAKNSNLRQLVEERVRRKRIRTREIRMREVGSDMGNRDDFKIKKLEYGASAGKEVFISYENGDSMLAGFLRLRIPHAPFRKEIDAETALVRELHVYGAEAGVGERDPKKAQHSGFGSMLLEEAERIAQEQFGMKKMLVISGIGARDYYRKRGYRLRGAYMAKRMPD